MKFILYSIELSFHALLEKDFLEKDFLTQLCFCGKINCTMGIARPQDLKRPLLLDRRWAIAPREYQDDKSELHNHSELSTFPFPVKIIRGKYKLIPIWILMFIMRILIMMSNSGIT